MTFLLLSVFTAALIGVLFFGKKHEVLIANVMNTLLLTGLAIASGMHLSSGGLFYLILIFYYVVPMYAVITLFGVMKKNNKKKQKDVFISSFEASLPDLRGERA